MRVLTLEIIVWIIGSLYFILTPHLASSTLAGSDKSICERNVSRMVEQEEFYTEWGWKWWTILPYPGLDTKIRLVNKTIHTQEQICCENYTNINQICFPKDRIKPHREVCNTKSSFSKCHEDSKSSTDLKECWTIAVNCNLTLENSKKLGDLCNRCQNCTTAWSRKSCKPKCEHKRNEYGWCTDKHVCACHFDFRIDDKTTNCVPLCDEKCKHGHCVAKNKCNCSKGWEGDLCDVAAHCRLDENDEKNSDISDNSTNYWDLPICHSGCREKINGTMMEKRTILISSTCNDNVIGFLIKYGPWIFLTVVLIVLVCFTTCIVCCIKKMKKPVDSNYGLELIPSTTTSHMEENDLYATVKTTF